MGSRIPLVLTLAALLALAAATACTDAPDDSLVLMDVDGVVHGSLARPLGGKWTVLFFLMTDCPIANWYAPEIQQICDAYAPKGTRCFLDYVDPTATVAAVKKHKEEFGYSCCPAILDRTHEFVRKAGATVSGEVAVFGENAELKYVGRVDDFYAALGKPKRRATQHDLREALDSLIAGWDVRQPRTEAFGCFIPETDSGD